MHDAEKIKPLEIEMKKVAALDGKMAIVAIPNRYAAKARSLMSDVDTVITYLDCEIIAMIGAGANEASAKFMSVPKGIVVYPVDGKDVQQLIFLAIERLNQIGDSAWSKNIWETIKETSAAEFMEDPEIRFVRSTFYQFLSFISIEAEISGRVINQMPPSSQETIKDLLPAGVVHRISNQGGSVDNDLDALIEKWSYNDKMKKKKEVGAQTLKKFRTFEQLNTLPVVSQRIIMLARDMDASASKMAALIESDPAITSKILKIVNSAFYGFHRKIESVEHAIVILGNNEVVNLSITLALNKFIMDTAHSNVKNLWTHSLFTAHLAHWLGPFFGCRAADLTYTVGLLHDIGKIALIQYGIYTFDIDAYSDIFVLAQEENAYGLSHAELGAYIADRWQLPEEIVDVLRAHHLPAIALNESLAATIHIADYIAHTGRLDMDIINNYAAEFMRRPGMSLTQEIITRAHMDMKKKVEMILSI